MNNNLISPRTEQKKRGTNSQLPRSKPLSSLNSARRVLLIPPSKCSLCDKKAIKSKDNRQFVNLSNKCLYTKYASSQNYYYTKDINELLGDSHTPIVIRLKDFQCYDESEEYLKRFYKASEYPNKIQLLTEYYKFHWDIPRLFMLPITDIINRYHDRKRRLQYIRVTKMLKEQKEAKTLQSKPSEELKTKTSEIKPMPITDQFLVGLETSHSIIAEAPNQREQENKFERTLRPQALDSHRKFAEVNHQEELKKEPKRDLIGFAKPREEINQKETRDLRQRLDNRNQPRKEASVSNTIQDLNIRLGEIISNSEVKLAETNYFDRNDQSLNESLSNLKNFLNYLKVNANTQNTSHQTLQEITKTVQQDQPQNRPTLVDTTKKTFMIKSSTPRQDKIREEEAVAQQGPRSTRVDAVVWSRTDSNALITPSPSELVRRESSGVNEARKFEEKTKVVNSGALVDPGHISSGQSSLSSTMTSKSKSVYPSITKIRNFEEAVKISQQTSQLKIASPTDATKYSNMHGKIHLNPMGHIQNIEHPEASPSGDLIYKNMSSSTKTPLGPSEDKSKESNKETSPTSKQSSQLLSPIASKSTSKLNQIKNQNFYPAKPSEGFVTRNIETASAQTQSPTFRIKSHREVGTSFDRNSKELFNQPASTKNSTNMQASLVRGHIRFASGSFTPQGSKNQLGKAGTPLQTGRDLKNLAALGALENKDSKGIPNSASRREAMLNKGDGTSNSAMKMSEGHATDREKEVPPPMSPKIVSTHRAKFVSHKHTRSEGGKLPRFDQLEGPMGSLNDQKIKELLRLTDPTDNFSDCTQKLKNGELLTKKVSSYNNNTGSTVNLASNREINYDTPTTTTNLKRQMSRNNGELIVNGSNGGLISSKNTKPDLVMKQKGQLKKTDNFSNDLKQKSGITSTFQGEREEIKSLRTKGSGTLTSSNFYKTPTQTKEQKWKYQLKDESKDTEFIPPEINAFEFV